MVVALPVVAIALLLLVAAWILAQLTMLVLEGLARELPVIGRYVRQGAQAAVDWAQQHVNAWAAAGLHKLAGWLEATRDALTGLPEQLREFAGEVVDSLDHLTHVTVHEIVKAFVNPVRAAAADAAADATKALHGIDELARDVAGAIGAAEGRVATKIKSATDAIRDVDLPGWAGTLERDYTKGIDSVRGKVSDLAGFTEGEFGRVWGRLDNLPWQQLLALLVTVPALAALVTTIADEAGLGRPDCRRKVRGICATDPLAWEQLLAAVVPLFVFESIDELIELAQELAPDVLDALEVVTGRAGLG